MRPRANLPRIGKRGLLGRQEKYPNVDKYALRMLGTEVRKRCRLEALRTFHGLHGMGLNAPGSALDRPRR